MKTLKEFLPFCQLLLLLVIAGLLYSVSLELKRIEKQIPRLPTQAVPPTPRTDGHPIPVYIVN